MDLLQRLNIKSVNPGAFSGHGWHSDNHAHTLESFNPSTGNKLAEIATCTMDDYEQVMRRAEQAAQAWKKVPAPKRGEIIRQIGQALREKKTVWEVLYHWKWVSLNRKVMVKFRK
nr:aldehyde dehydrogenase family protein [Legionella pneumophila]